MLTGELDVAAGLGESLGQPLQAVACDEGDRSATVVPGRQPDALRVTLDLYRQFARLSVPQRVRHNLLYGTQQQEPLFLVDVNVASQFDGDVQPRDVFADVGQRVR